MREVPAAEFNRNFGVYRELVRQEPVAVMADGHAAGYFISAPDYEELQRLKAKARRVRRIEELTEEEIEEMTATRMSPEHDHLNSLLDE